MLRIFEALGTGFVRFCWISQRCCSTCPWRVTLAPSEAKKIAGLMDTILIGGTKNIFKMDVHPTKTGLNYCNRFWPTPTWYQDVQWSGDITGYNQRIWPICLCLMTSKLNMFAGENGCWLNMVCVCVRKHRHHHEFSNVFGLHITLLLEIPNCATSFLVFSSQITIYPDKTY